MRVAITGSLEGLSRQDAIALIEKVGATFDKSLTLNTNYLVAARLDTSKVKKALKYGTSVITQSEFEEFIDSGSFPDRDAPGKAAANWSSGPPQMNWVNLPEGEQALYELEYQDTDGIVSTRQIKLVASADYISLSGVRRSYFRAVDLSGDHRVKTYREDRVRSLLPIDEV